jgi:hypothetical protein
MSEHQRIAFRAIDGPVSKPNLQYMRRQSTRAEISPWAFDNEYHFGDFRGDALEMLRRGYDFHLHYANFGIRKLLIRMPNGLPDPNTAKAYLDGDALQFLKDKRGPGGALSIEPFHEPGDLEDLWDLDALIDRLAPLRAEILDGDLRPLYLAHLAVACDIEHDPEETTEAPVPAGLDELSDAQRALAELYGLSDSLIAAAAEGGPPRAARPALRGQYAEWLSRQSPATKDAWLEQCMADPNVQRSRSQLLAEFRKSQDSPLWPTLPLNRTIAELQATAQKIHDQAERAAAARAARQRSKQLAAMAADPARTLAKTEKLVRERSTAAYRQIAALLTDLREALAGTAQSHLAQQHAMKLRSSNPTLNKLTSELRREGLLPK